MTKSSLAQHTINLGVSVVYYAFFLSFTLPVFLALKSASAELTVPPQKLLTPVIYNGSCVLPDGRNQPILTGKGGTQQIINYTVHGADCHRNWRLPPKHPAPV